VTNTATSTVTNTATQTVTGPASTVTNTATSTVTQTTSSIPDWTYGAMVVLLILGLAIGYVVKRPSARAS
jgi:carbohydrate-binding DOMON domain-containing protein